MFPDCHENKHREILFLKETSELIAIWEGEKLNKKQAFETSGIQTVFWLDQFETVLNTLLSECSCVYLNNNEHTRANTEAETRESRFIKNFKKKYTNHQIERSAPIMHKIRSVKDAIEIALMKKACTITEKGFRRILSFTKP